MKNILFCVLLPLYVWSQNITERKSPIPKANTIESTLWTPIPVQAALYSTALPGLGQAYNKKYWKVPLVWGLLGTGIYAIGYYKKNYDRYHSRFVTAVNNGKDEYGYPPDELVRSQKRANRYYNYALLLTALAYVLNVIDALVDAHLYEIDQKEKFSLAPAIISQENMGCLLGFSLNIKLKNK